MRIVAGRWKGRAIEAPQGRGTTRPTTDRTREAAASMVASAWGLSLEGARVLDCFAGSGAMGLELLSRGAAHCVFWDRAQGAARVVRANLRALEVPRELWKVEVGDARTLAARATGPFDIVVLDPPYALDPALSATVVEALLGTAALAPDAVLLHERSADAQPLEVEGFRRLRERHHGQTVLSVYEREEPRAGGPGEEVSL